MPFSALRWRTGGQAGGWEAHAFTGTCLLGRKKPLYTQALHFAQLLKSMSRRLLAPSLLHTTISPYHHCLPAKLHL